MARAYLEKEDPNEWTEQDHAEYAADMKGLGVDLSTPAAIEIPELPGPDEIHVQDFRTVTAEEISSITRQLEIDPDPRATAARRRARRSHMIRKLKNRFSTYNPFTAEDAAIRCKEREGEMRTFLEFELSVPGTLLARQGNKYVITSPWL